MRWPWEWGRRTGAAETGPSAGASPSGPAEHAAPPPAAPAAADPGPRAWATLAPVQRSMAGFEPAVTPPDAFRASLSTHQNPSLLAPLGHLVDADGPSGTVGGLASSTGRPVPYEGAVELRVPDRPVTPTAAPVQRQIATLRPEPTEPSSGEVPASVPSSPEFTPSSVTTSYAGESVTDAGAPTSPAHESPVPTSPASGPAAEADGTTDLIAPLVSSAGESTGVPEAASTGEPETVRPSVVSPSAAPLVVARSVDPNGSAPTSTPSRTSAPTPTPVLRPAASSESAAPVQRTAAPEPAAFSEPAASSEPAGSSEAARSSGALTVQCLADDHSGHDHPLPAPSSVPAVPSSTPAGPVGSSGQGAAETSPAAGQPTVSRSAVEPTLGHDVPSPTEDGPTTAAPLRQGSSDPLTVPVQRSAAAPARTPAASATPTLRPEPTATSGSDAGPGPGVVPAPAAPVSELVVARQVADPAPSGGAVPVQRWATETASTTEGGPAPAAPSVAPTGSPVDHDADVPAPISPPVADAEHVPTVAGLLADGPALIGDVDAPVTGAGERAPAGSTTPLIVPTHGEPSAPSIQRQVADPRPATPLVPVASPDDHPSTTSSVPVSPPPADAEPEYPPLIARSVQRSSIDSSTPTGGSAEQAPLSGFAAAISALQGDPGLGGTPGADRPTGGDSSTTDGPGASGVAGPDLVVARQIATPTSDPGRSLRTPPTSSVALSAGRSFAAPVERPTLVVARRVAPDSTGQLPRAEAATAPLSAPHGPVATHLQRSLIADLPPLITTSTPAAEQTMPTAPAVQRLQYVDRSRADDHPAAAPDAVLAAATEDPGPSIAGDGDSTVATASSAPIGLSLISSSGSSSGSGWSAAAVPLQRSALSAPASVPGLAAGPVPGPGRTAGPAQGAPTAPFRASAQDPASATMAVPFLQRQFDAPTAFGAGSPGGPVDADPASAVSGRTVGLAEMFAMAAASSGGTGAGDAGPVQRSVDGSVQRSVDESVQRAEESAPAGPSVTAAPAAAPAGPAAVPSGAELEEMARRLYDPLSARLRAELWQDRERSGLLTDLRP